MHLKGKWFQWISSDSMKSYENRLLQTLTRRNEK
jgi:hypothetical protein